MNQTIYNSENNRGLLRSMGPYKILSSDNSISGEYFEPYEIITPQTIGKIKVIGKTITY